MKLSRSLISAWMVIAVVAVGLQAEENVRPHRPLVGAIRWDAWYGHLPDSVSLPDPRRYPGADTKRKVCGPNPGGEAQRALSPEAWRYRWPFFTTLNADGSVKEFNENRPEVLDREIDYAVGAGLDYWAFDAYPEDCPLSYTLKTFLTCKNRDKIKFCLYMVMGSAYGCFVEDEAFQDYVLRVLTQSNYLKVQGNRPVLYVGFLNDRLVSLLCDGRWERFCDKVKAKGLGRPYVLIGYGWAQKAKSYCEQLHGDGLSNYNVVGNAKGGTFAELAARTEAFWEQCAATGATVAPICVMGWDRRTRVTNPVSWETFHLKPDAMEFYYRSGTPEELAAHIGRGVSWFDKHPGQKGSELVLIYAWNEIDEGGWLVPALPPPQGQGTARLDALRKVLKTR